MQRVNQDTRVGVWTGSCRASAAGQRQPAAQAPQPSASIALIAKRELSPRERIIAAIKADTLSLAAWQVGMYSLMAVVQFVAFRGRFGGAAPVNSVEFWGAMQVAMIAGFVTSYTMNWWLIRASLKERM